MVEYSYLHNCTVFEARTDGTISFAGIMYRYRCTVFFCMYVLPYYSLLCSCCWSDSHWSFWWNLSPFAPAVSGLFWFLRLHRRENWAIEPEVCNLNASMITMLWNKIAFWERRLSFCARFSTDCYLLVSSALSGRNVVAVLLRYNIWP